MEFACMLAQQCFNTDYAFAESAEELDLLERQRKLLSTALEGEGAVAPLQLRLQLRPVTAGLM